MPHRVARPWRPRLADLRPGHGDRRRLAPAPIRRGEAVHFAITEYDVPAIPSLPRRCPAEGMIAQAVVGINGVTAGQYGSIAVDPAAVDPYAPVITDIATDSFCGSAALPRPRRGGRPRRTGQVAVRRAGDARRGAHPCRVWPTTWRSPSRRGRSARTSCRCRRRSPRRCPRSPQIVVIDEPWFGELFKPGFPIAPDPAIDLLSGAMASVSGVATVGVHCCGDADVASLLAAGPDVLSIPARPAVAGAAGYLARFLEGGGRIAWGVVATDGPMFVSPDRQWRELGELWAELEQRGVDADAAAPAQPRHGALRPRAAHPGRRRAGLPGGARDRPPRSPSSACDDRYP